MMPLNACLKFGYKSRKPKKSPCQGLFWAVLVQQEAQTSINFIPIYIAKESINIASSVCSVVNKISMLVDIDDE